MKFGINTLLYAGTFKDEHLKLFKRFKDMGFDGVEVALEKKGDIDYKRTLEELKKNDLKCCSICGLFGPDRDIRGPNKEWAQNSISYMRDCIDACVELECNLFVGPAYSSVGRANLETPEDRAVQWKEAVKNFKEICKYAEGKSVYIAIEPLNRFETDFINVAKDAIKMVEDVGSDMLKIHLDTFHMSIEEKSSKQAIIDSGKDLYLLHASENDRGAPGTGQVRWNEIASALKVIGYDKYIVIESFTPEVKVIAKAASIWRQTEENGFVLAQKGLNYLKELLA